MLVLLYGRDTEPSKQQPETGRHTHTEKDRTSISQPPFLPSLECSSAFWLLAGPNLLVP